MAGIGSRLAAWKRRHPRLTAGGLVVLAALLGWGGYEGFRYYRARSHFNAARQAADRHQWPEANDHVKASLRYGPNSPGTRLLAARVARRLERHDEAEEQLAACERLEGGETQAIKVERALLSVHRRGDLAGVEDFLRACVRQDDPDTVEILDILSSALLIDYRVAEAQRCLDDLVTVR